MLEVHNMCKNVRDGRKWDSGTRVIEGKDIYGTGDTNEKNRGLGTHVKCIEEEAREQ